MFHIHAVHLRFEVIIFTYQPSRSTRPKSEQRILRNSPSGQRKRLEYFNLHQGEDTPVSANSKRGFMRPPNLSKITKAFLLNNDFDPILTLPLLRHGYVTHSLDRGFHANQIEQISSQTPKVVLDTYSNHRSEIVIKRR